MSYEQKMSPAPLLDECPHCGAETEQGFGLAGGGYGVYVYCPTDSCDYFAKLQVEDWGRLKCQNKILTPCSSMSVAFGA